MDSKMEKLEQKLHSVAAKSKQLVHRDKPTADPDRLPGVTDNAAFNTEAMPASTQDQRTKKEKIVGNVKSAGQWIAHPTHNIKNTASGKIMPNERPWLKDQGDADQKLIHLHDELDDQMAQLDGDITKPDKDLSHNMRLAKADVSHQRQKVDDLKAERNELQVTFHMSRYVRRVRVVHKPTLAYPNRHDYKQYDADGRYLRLDWTTWLGHLILYACQDFSSQYINPTNELAYDKEVLIAVVERLLVASGTFQLWWFRVRKVYRWEDPRVTAKWLLAYLVLLKTGYIMSFYWGYLLYSALSNRYGRHSRQWNRESHERARATRARAEMASEFVVRHGKDKWLDPLLEEFGPWIQLQLGDSAHFLEMCANYYDWVNVGSTTATCCAYAALLLVSALPRLEFSIKVFWLSAGLYFFISRPISANYPRFHHALDPLRWMYWDSPTTSEWAFTYLYNHAQAAVQNNRRPAALSDHGLGGKEASSDDEDEAFYDAASSLTPSATPHCSNDLRPPMPTILKFPARWNGKHGHLELSASSLRYNERRFSSRSKDTIRWERPYTELLEVRKIKQQSGHASRAPSEGLGILWTKLLTQKATPDMADDDISSDLTELLGMTKEAQEEAFNSIIGFSGLRWMELQRDPKAQDGIQHEIGA